MANPVGRPLKFQSVEELDQRIEEYFRITPSDDVTWTGLALHLDCDRETFTNYQYREEFSASVKKALNRVQLEYERDLRRKGRSGDIFALKNFGWRDTQNLDHTSNGDNINFGWQAKDEK